MATNSEEILLRMGLDDSALKRGLNQAKGGVESFARGLVGRLAPAMAAAFSVSSIDRMISKFDELDDRANNLEISTDFLQGMSEISRADAVGGVETFNKFIAELSTKLGQAKSGSEEAAKAFAKWGFTMEEIQSLDAEQMFYRIADQIKNTTDPTLRLAEAFELGGKSGKNLVGVLQNGSEALKSMVDSVDKLDEEKIKRLGILKSDLQAGANTITTYLGRLVGGAALVLDKLTMIDRSPSRDVMREIMDANRPTIGDVPDAKLTPKSKELQRLLDERDRRAQASLERMQSTSARISDANRTILDLKKQISELDSDQADADEKRVALTLKISDQEDKIAKAKKEQSDADNSAGRLKIKIQQAEMTMAQDGALYPTISDLAGRKFANQLNKKYGAGGIYDLGAGDGPYAANARDYLLAEKQQIWDRTHGNMAAAEDDRRRMLAERDYLIDQGVATPQMTMEKMRENTDAMRQHLQKLISGGAKLPVKILDED